MSPSLRMTPSPVVRAAADPRNALCRTFCRHYVRLTGTGLAAGSRRPTTKKDEGK